MSSSILLGSIAKLFNAAPKPSLLNDARLLSCEHEEHLRIAGSAVLEKAPARLKYAVLASKDRLQEPERRDTFSCAETPKRVEVVHFSCERWLKFDVAQATVHQRANEARYASAAMRAGIHVLVFACRHASHPFQ
jgi:hypothetical protein